MPWVWEYHIVVRRRIPASVALFSLLALPAVFVSSGLAQAGGAAASANSSGAGGHSFASAPATSTSAGSHGFTSQSSGNAPAKPESSANSGQFHHHHNRDHIGEVYALPIPYPIAVGAPENETETETDESDAEYQGGPTIFDRRGSGPDSYVPPVRKVPTPHSGVSNAALSVPDVPQEPTLLIFKDGHKLEVGNYAIVGANLVDLTPGHQRTVALADLDLGATRRQNNERGVIFLGPRQVPRVN